MTFLGGISLFFFFSSCLEYFNSVFFREIFQCLKDYYWPKKSAKRKISLKIISISRNFYILLLTKSWIGISQRKSGCQESAVDRGWGRSFRHLDGI